MKRKRQTPASDWSQRPACLQSGEEDCRLEVERSERLEVLTEVPEGPISFPTDDQ